MNPFTALPAKLRQKFYVAYGFATLAISSVAVYDAAVDAPVPTWVKGAGAVLVPIGGLLGATAASNVKPDQAHVVDEGPGV